MNYLQKDGNKMGRYDKRTSSQCRFDWTLRGISFCNYDMAQCRIKAAQEILLKHLPDDAKRKATLEFWINSFENGKG